MYCIICRRYHEILRQHDLLKICIQHQKQSITDTRKFKAMLPIDLNQQDYFERSIGPATSCGEDDTNNAYFRKILLRVNLAPVHINRIAKCLKRVERNARPEESCIRMPDAAPRSVPVHTAARPYPLQNQSVTVNRDRKVTDKRAAPHTSASFVFAASPLCSVSLFPTAALMRTLIQPSTSASQQCMLRVPAHIKAMACAQARTDTGSDVGSRGRTNVAPVGKKLKKFQ